MAQCRAQSSGHEVPTQIRDVAGTGLAQARTAFGSVVGAARRASDRVGTKVVRGQDAAREAAAAARDAAGAASH
ncbi:hypothetical protein SAMN02799625_02678 [Methylobacterium sp. UNC300MFChir4.1]|uniref:hypothetical protein n=1 Tax=Methylobacterium sp. UNC300MFChir4.1 TaxID=1502747 RepID=UPI0008CCD472|nr:hypothetical protein [Methylobacterium sp. UNC300MFChir4.1]SEO18798.1 hypothetical protein SAMN02799625_02678 [Methylobacterium sp. UNC300MFChir4.1]